MKKTHFQLPPRANAPVGVDRWVSRESAVAASPPANAALAFASAKPSEMPASANFPFMFDMAALLAAHRRNVEAIAAANRVVREAAQAVARRNLQVMQQAIDGISECVQIIGISECPRDRTVRQTELAIRAYEYASNNVRELATLIQHANTEAMEVLSRRFTEAADEVKARARRVARAY